MFTVDNANGNVSSRNWISL